jgi:hypothetical protein
MGFGAKRPSTINITTPGDEESLRKWFSALLESCLLLSREIGEPWNDEILSGWLAKSRQSASHAYCRVCNCDFKVEHGARLNEVTKHSVTESTELNPGCQQPFLFDKMSSAAKTSAPKKSATKKAVKLPKITLIGSTKTKEEVKMSSFIYQKTALLRDTKFSQKES